MLKLIGLTTFALLIAVSAAAWSHSAMPAAHHEKMSIQTNMLSSMVVPRTIDSKSLPVEKIEDRTFVFSDSD